MDRERYLSLLWHMHQPLYKSAATNDYLLPWVRLHATKGYLDIATLALRYPEVGQTINLVPSLLLQIEDYLAGGVTDRFRLLSEKPAAELTPDDKRFVLTYFFSINWDTCIKPWPRYWSLLRQRGLEIHHTEIDHAMGRFSEADYRDLQALFNLAWCGFTARKEPEIAELIVKGQHFGEEDKAVIAEFQHSCLERLLLLWRKLASDTAVKISASPFYHPILPLLADTRNAAQHVSRETIERIGFRHPEDAEEQISRGISYVTQIIGAQPSGMWPSEGSVSPDLVAMFTKAGVEWIATDQAILERSRVSPAGAPACFCYPYRLGGENGGLSIFFRNTSLSDAVGFRYHQKPGAVAAAEFLGEVKNTADHCPGDDPPVVSVILDGENPWEYYADGGESFLTNLFERLADGAMGVKPTTFSGYLSRYRPPRVIEELYPGSWIKHDFSIWIGDNEKDRAWELLSQTRSFVDEHLGSNPDVPQDVRASVFEHIYAAEGSDWFWWYGDPFHTEYDTVFDLLFRQHLAHIYELLGQTVPAELKVPISEKARFEPDRQPVDVVEPTLDGRVTSYFEWVDAGLFVPKIAGTVMVRNKAPAFKSVQWGFDGPNLYIRVDFTEETLLDNGLLLVVRFYHPAERALVVKLTRGTTFCHFYEPDGEHFQTLKVLGSVAVGDVVEIGLPFAVLGAKEREIVNFALYTSVGDEYVERCPFDGTITFTCPGEDYRMQLWKG